MAVKIGSARIDERGKARGGKAGDNNGHEVEKQLWYNRITNPWVLIRAKDAAHREKIARCMEMACANNKIGYDQGDRDTLYQLAAAYGYDVSKVNSAVETDCSALVRVCVRYALGTYVPNFRTTDEAAVLLKTGQFDKFTDRRYIHSADYLLRGDILVTKKQGHTVVVLTDGAKAYPLGARIIGKGAFGPDVGEMQRLLLGLAYSMPKYGADHDFGAETLAAVRAFQADAGLIVDGTMDAADFAKLAYIATNGWPKPEEPAPPPPAIPTPEETVYLVRGCFPDISSNQGRIRDFDKFCAKTDCAIFRVVRENLEIDSEALYNMKNCAARKHPFGVYVFFKAWTDLTARTFVRKLYQNSALYDPRFYVLDIEGWYPKAAVLAAIDEARKLGIARLGVYMGSYRWRTRYKKMLAALVDFVWLANYGKNTGWLSNIPDNPCALHQFTSRGQVPGVADKTCDLNRLTGNVPLSYFTGRKHSGDGYVPIVQATGNVYVRQGPGTQYKAIAKIPKGRYAIRRDGSVRGWAAVNYEGRDGYVSETYIKAVVEG